MSDSASARRIRILEELADGGSGRDLAAFAGDLQVDERTIRRDLDFLQRILSQVQGIQLRRGNVHAVRGSSASGYFGDQMKSRREVKSAIARAVVGALDDNTAIAITAGSTVYYVARELRRAVVEGGRPRNPIAFTNSLPALLELIAGGISTGVFGEIYDPDDSAFHSHQLTSTFHPNVAIVGASGVVANGSALALYSHRGEEAAFMRQLLAHTPDVWVAVDASKIGRRHPWAFTDSRLLSGKSIRLFTGELDSAQRDSLNDLRSAAPSAGYSFAFEEVMQS